MTTLLKISTSLSGAAGRSTQLLDRIVAQWQAQNPQAQVVTRDLATDPVPHLTPQRMQALFSKPAGRTAEQQEVVDYSDVLIAELQSADVIVLAAPMYNFGIPSTLRAYFDHISRSGVTFRYSESGPEGLIKNKKAYVVVTRGSFYTAEQDSQTPYLRQFLGFIGITDVEFIHAEGLDIDAATRQKSLDAAHAAIDRIAPLAQAA